MTSTAIFSKSVSADCCLNLAQASNKNCRAWSRLGLYKLMLRGQISGWLVNKDNTAEYGSS